MKIKQILVCCFIMLALPASASDLEAYLNQGTSAKVLFVLDASGSMLLTEGGDIASSFDNTRMKTLTESLESVIDALGDTERLQFGMTWFGGLTAGGIKLPMRPLKSPANELYNINYSSDFTGDEIDFGELFLNTVQNIYTENEYDPSGYDVLKAGLYDSKTISNTDFNISRMPECYGKTVKDLLDEANLDSSVAGGFSDDDSTTGDILSGSDRPFIWSNSGAGADGSTPWPMMSDPASDSDVIPATWVQVCPEIPALCDQNATSGWWDPDFCSYLASDGVTIVTVDRFAGEWPSCTVGQPTQVFGCESTFFTLMNETQLMQTPTVDALFEATRYFRGERVFFGMRDHFPSFDEDEGRYFDAVEVSSYTGAGFSGDPSLTPARYNRAGMPANTEFFTSDDVASLASAANDYTKALSGPIAALGWRSVNRAALTTETRDKLRHFVPMSYWATTPKQLQFNIFTHEVRYEVAEARWNLFYDSIFRVNILESPYTDFDDFMATSPSLDDLSELDREGDVSAGGVTYESIIDDPHFDCEDVSATAGWCTKTEGCPPEAAEGCVPRRYDEFYPGTDPGTNYAGTWPSDTWPSGVTFTAGDVWCEHPEIAGEWIESSTITRSCDMRIESVADYDSPIDECSNQAIILISDGYPTGNFVDNGDQSVDPEASFADYAFGDYNFTSAGLIRKMIHNNTDETLILDDYNFKQCDKLFPGALSGTLEWKINVAGGCGTELASFLANHQQVAGKALSTVKTHAIGFNIDGIGKTFLEELAAAGKGVYASASNGSDLVESIESMISLAQTPTADTPALVINLDNSSLTTENIVYAPVFRASNKTVWAGNVKAYFLNPELDENGFERTHTKPYVKDGLRSFWSNEDTVVLPDDVEDPSHFTTLHGGVNTYLMQSDKTVNPRRMYLEKEEWEDSGAFAKAYKVGHPTKGPTAEYLGIEDASLSESENIAAVDELMEWFALQPLGDSLHSKPTLISYTGSHTLPDGTTVTDPRILYVVSNRGLLHAFDISHVGSDINGSGQSFINASRAPVELGAWMPHSLAKKIDEQKNAPWGSGHIYGLDGEIRTWREPVVGSGGAVTYNTYLLLGMRRGGGAYYKIDVTNPGEFEVDWRVDADTAGFEDLGQTWSPMSVLKVPWSGGDDKYIGVVGGGYDEVDDLRGTSRLDTTARPGAGLYLIDMDDGSLIASVGGLSSDATFKNLKMLWGIPSEIRVIDSTGDGYADRLYYGDLGGQLWRTDIIADGETSSVSLTSNVILDTGGATAENHRRIYEPPAVAYLPSGQMAVVVTTGYRSHPLNGATINPTTEEPYPIIRDGVFMIKDLGTYPLGLPDLQLIGDTEVSPASITKGWKLFLREELAADAPEGSEWIGEKVLSEPVIFNNRVLFTTMIPEAGADICSVSATQNRFYSLKLANGAPSGDLRSPTTTVVDPDDPDGISTIEVPGDPVPYITLASSNAIESEMAISVETNTSTCGEGKACGDFYVGTQSVGKYELTPGKVYWKETGVIQDDARFE